MNVYTQPGRIDQYNWQVELGWETFALTGTCACNALFDNVLETDETPAGTVIVPAATVVVPPSTAPSSWFILLIGVIGAAMGLLAGSIILGFMQRKKAKTLPG